MTCTYCGCRTTRPGRRSRPSDASREHVVALAAGGGDDFGNRATACRRCNTVAGDWPPAWKAAFGRLMRASRGGPDPRSWPRARLVAEVSDMVMRDAEGLA